MSNESSDYKRKNTITTFDGEIVNPENGEVLDREIDRGPEWRAFDEEQRSKRTRTGAPLTYTIHDKGLSTVIDWHNRDVYGRNLSRGQKEQVYRLRKWQTRTRISGATERNLAYALNNIAKISDNLNLPQSVVETASRDYQEALKKRLIRGRSIAAVSTAAVYLSCRECGMTKSIRDVSQAANMSQKEVGRYYRFLVKNLGRSVSYTKPSQYITKFSNQLTMQGKMEEIAHKTLSVAKELRMTSGRGPQGIAAASSYIASVLAGEKKTQKEIAEIAQVTDVTIRNRYKELAKKLQFNMSL